MIISSLPSDHMCPHVFVYDEYNIWERERERERERAGERERES